MVSRNPVFALEMIQTKGYISKMIKKKELSQSSIRPGDDSDQQIVLIWLFLLLCRNPVFALEMIQTRFEFNLIYLETMRRNPVFALEMIQTITLFLSK